MSRETHMSVILTSALMLVLLLLLPSMTLAQSDGGQVDNQESAQDDALNSDPNLVNPQNKQGYGKNVPIQVITKSKAKPGGKAGAKAPLQKTIGEQTHQALLQFGVLVRSVSRDENAVRSLLNSKTSIILWLLLCS